MTDSTPTVDRLNALVALLRDRGHAVTWHEHKSPPCWTVQGEQPPTVPDVNVALRIQNDDLAQTCKQLQDAVVTSAAASADHMRALSELLRTLGHGEEEEADQEVDAFAKHPQYVRSPAVRGLLGGTHGLWSEGHPVFFAVGPGECDVDGCSDDAVAFVLRPGLRLMRACGEHVEHIRARLNAGVADIVSRDGLDHGVIGPASDWDNREEPQ